MDNDVLRFLQQQITWVREQDLILAKIEGKLWAMRALAQYRLDTELMALEVERLNEQLGQLEREVAELELQLDAGTVH